MNREFRVAIVAIQGGGHWGHKFLQVADEVILGTPSMTWGNIADVTRVLDPVFVTAHYDPAIMWTLRNVPLYVPTFAHFHTEPTPDSDLIDLLADATQRCRRVFFPSIQTLQQYQELLLAPEPNRLAVIPNVLPQALSETGVAAGSSRRQHRSISQKRVAIVSRLDLDKFSIPLFIAAVRALRDLVPSLTIRVAGTGEADGTIRRASLEAGLDEFVDFLGYVDDIVEVYKTSDAVFVPSYTEAMPYTAIEAAALGVPCILPRVGYFADTTQGLPAVATFKPEDHDGAAELLRSAVMREPPFDRIGELPLTLRYEAWSERVALCYELEDCLNPLDRSRQVNRGRPL
jgi:glycosyltransferase involved in cell wall biosynthesis